MNLVHGHARTGPGKSPTREYRTWKGMKRRCLSPKHEHYARYGGRGIKIYQPWIDSFERFLLDVGPRPEGTSLDRYPDADGDYEPGNVRWASALEQSHNRTDLRLDATDVRFIRLWLERGHKQRDIARAFGVSFMMVSRIKDGSRWGSVV